MSKYKSSYAKLAVNRKNKYASDCGAGKEGSSGFQPGNTCAGDGGTGGGDAKQKPKMPKKPKDPLDKKQLGIAIDTLENPAKALMGGPSVSESREMLAEKFGYNDEQLDWLQYGQHGEDAPDTGGGEGSIPEGAKLHKGDYYWEDYNDAKNWASENGWELETDGHDNIKSFGQGWSVQAGPSGNYAGQDPETGEEVNPREWKGIDGMDDADTGAGEGFDETPGADAPSKEDIEAMEGLDIMQPDTGAGEGLADEDVLFTGSGKIELPLSEEAKRDGATIYNTDMSHISDEILNEELNQIGDGWDVENMDRQEREGLMLESLVMDAEDRAFETGAGEGGGEGGVPDSPTSEGGKPYGTDSDMRVWIGDLGAHNAGELKGEWVNASDVQEAWEHLRENEGYGEEYYIGDVEGVPRDLAGQYGYGDLDEIANYANTMESHDNPEAFQAYVDATGLNMEDAVEQFEDRYAGEAGDMGRRGSYDLPMGFVYDLIDDTGGVEEIMKNNPGSYVDREKLVRDLSYDNRYDIQEDDEGSKVVDEDGEVVYHGSDFDDAEGWIKQSDEELADELIEGGGLSNPDSYFDYEQYAFDLVIGGDIMVSDGYVFWNQ